MPAKYHQVSPDMWNRNTRRMSKDAVLALAYIRTCPHRLTEGLFQLAPEHIAADTPLTVPEAEAALVELVECGEIAYDDLHEYVFDRRALRDYPLKFGKTKAGDKAPDKRLEPFLARFDAMPDTHLKQELADVAWETSDALAEALAERGIWRSEPPDDEPAEEPDDSPSGSPLDSPSHSPSTRPLPSPSGGTSRDETETEESPRRDRAVTSKSRDETLRCVNAGQEGCEGTADPDLTENDGTAWCAWCAPSAVHMAARIRGAS